MSWGRMILIEMAGSIVLAYLFIWFFFFNPHKGPDREQLWPGTFQRLWFNISFVFFIIFALGDGMVSLAPFVRRGYTWMMQACGVAVSHLLLATLVMALGVSAFIFKSKYQRTYGIVEVLFAGVAAVVAARQIKVGQDWSGQLATLVGCIYIVSRGLSNVRDGLLAQRQAEANDKRMAGTT